MPLSERSSLQSAQLSFGDGVDFRLSEPLPLTQHSAAVYLSGLGEGSVSTMRHSLMRSRPCSAMVNAMHLPWIGRS